MCTIPTRKGSVSGKLVPSTPRLINCTGELEGVLIPRLNVCHNKLSLELRAGNVNSQNDILPMRTHFEEI